MESNESKMPKFVELGLWIATISLFCLTILTFIGVIFRYVIFRSIPWAIELSQLFLMWMTYFGTAAVCYKNDHITIDILGGFLSETGKAIRQLLSNIIIFIMMTLMIVTMVPYTINLSQARRVSAAIGIPQWIVFVTFLVGLGMLDCVHFLNIIRTTRDIVGKKQSGGKNEKIREGDRK